MATVINVNVYKLGNQTSGFPKKMNFPASGYTAIDHNENVGGTATYTNVLILGTNQNALIVETTTALEGLANA